MNKPTLVILPSHEHIILLQKSYLRYWLKIVISPRLICKFSDIN